MPPPNQLWVPKPILSALAWTTSTPQVFTEISSRSCPLAAVAPLAFDLPIYSHLEDSWLSWCGPCLTSPSSLQHRPGRGHTAQGISIRTASVSLFQPPMCLQLGQTAVPCHSSVSNYIFVFTCLPSPPRPDCKLCSEGRGLSC